MTVRGFRIGLPATQRGEVPLKHAQGAAVAVMHNCTPQSVYTPQQAAAQNWMSQKHNSSLSKPQGNRPRGQACVLGKALQTFQAATCVSSSQHQGKQHSKQTHQQTASSGSNRSARSAGGRLGAVEVIPHAIGANLNWVNAQSCVG